MEEPFKSVEHAFFWRMATDLGKPGLAARIKDAVHAGVVKRLSKDMEEDIRHSWEDKNMHIMEELLNEKAKSCKPFREYLLMNKHKILAESTINKRWGTGLNNWVTEATKPNFWPGLNWYDNP